LLVVRAAELANEVLVRLQYGSWRWSDTLGDATNTHFFCRLCCAWGYCGTGA
jgi:hypothetical protein